MMMAAMEQFVESLRTQPLSLALVAMNLALLVFVYYMASAISAERTDMVKLLAACGK